MGTHLNTKYCIQIIHTKCIDICMCVYRYAYIIPGPSDGHVSFIFVTGLIHVCGTRLIHICDMTYLHV